MEGVEIPSHFLCPISLQMMKDPVALPTGITYDRDAIERWILVRNRRRSCPVTNCPLPDSFDLTPNHTLRRLIQLWCTANASLGFERFPTPRPPVDKSRLSALLAEARLPHSRLESLRALRRIVSDSDRNKRIAASYDSGVPEFLASVISASSGEDEQEEAISILCSLQLQDHELLLQHNQHFLHSLTSIMQRSSSYETRAYSTLLVKSVIAGTPSARSADLPEPFFREISRVLRDRISYRATKAALRVLHEVCVWGERNAARAVEAGAVPAVVDLLMDETEMRACEMMLVVLDNLCRCAEGSWEVVRHPAGVAVVSKKIMRGTAAASERAVRILYLIARHSARNEVLREMAEVGAVAKLCVLASEECTLGGKAREMAKEILRMHSRFWRTSACASSSQLRFLNKCL